MISECPMNADQIASECWRNDIRMLANLLMDIDLINRNGHMDPAVYGAIVNLVAMHMDRIADEWGAALTHGSVNAA